MQQSNLRFRPEALTHLSLPFAIRSGTVGRLTLKLPLGALATQATVVVLDEVYVVAGPAHVLYDERFEARLQETKRRRLQVAEALKGDLDEAKTPGFLGRSVGRIAETGSFAGCVCVCGRHC